MPTRRKGSAQVMGKIKPPIKMSQYQGTKRGGRGKKK